MTTAEAEFEKKHPVLSFMYEMIHDVFWAVVTTGTFYFIVWEFFNFLYSHCGRLC